MTPRILGSINEITPQSVRRSRRHKKALITQNGILQQADNRAIEWLHGQASDAGTKKLIL